MRASLLLSLLLTVSTWSTKRQVQSSAEAPKPLSRSLRQNAPTVQRKLEDHRMGVMSRVPAGGRRALQLNAMSRSCARRKREPELNQLRSVDALAETAFRTVSPTRC